MVVQQQHHRSTSIPSAIFPSRRNASLQQQPNSNAPQQQQQPRQQQHQQQHHEQSNSSNNVNSSGNIISNSNSLAAPSPLLFERLVTEESVELKTYSRIIESQNRRLADLEVSHDDLERRLEMETQKRISVQQDLDRQNLEWQQKYETLEKDLESWKKLVNAERAKNERLLDQVMRKDREIHRMIQRKYDAKGNQHPNHQSLPHASVGITNRSSPNNQAPNGASHQNKVAHKSPHELLAAKGSGEAVREHNVTSSLKDFFGF